MPPSTGESASHANRPVIGWRESVSLPEWGIKRVTAKIDTGARTSAIHVEGIRKLANNRVRFDVVLSRKKKDNCVPVTTKLVRVTRVRSSTGHRQERYVVSTQIRLGRLRRTIELSLVKRDQLLCRMLLGRNALRELLIDAEQTYLLTDPPAKRNTKTPP